MAAKKPVSKNVKSASTTSASRGTSSGPSHPDASNADALVQKAAATQAVVASMPFNANKPAEYARETNYAPPEGQHVAAPANVAGSSLSEANVS